MRLRSSIDSCAIQRRNLLLVLPVAVKQNKVDTVPKIYPGRQLAQESSMALKQLNNNNGDRVTSDLLKQSGDRYLKAFRNIFNNAGSVEFKWCSSLR